MDRADALLARDIARAAYGEALSSLFTKAEILPLGEVRYAAIVLALKMIEIKSQALARSGVLPLADLLDNFAIDDVVDSEAAELKSMVEALG